MMRQYLVWSLKGIEWVFLELFKIKDLEFTENEIF